MANRKPLVHNSGQQEVLQSADALDIGAAVGTSLAVNGALSSSSRSAGIGYTTGAGNTVTQSGNKSSTVTINAMCGTITMTSTALASGNIVSFTVTNSGMTATDIVLVCHNSVGTLGAYDVQANTSAGGSFQVTVKNISAGSLSEAIVIRFAIIKAVTA